MQRQDYLPADEATILQESVTRWPGLELLSAQDDIRRPTEWQIHESRHAVIVHLAGRMKELETELEAHGGSRGSALPGECWAIPAGQRYVSRARGQTIRYAVLYLDTPLPWVDGNTSSGEMCAHSAVRDPFLFHSVQRLIEAAASSNDVERMLGEALSRAMQLHVRRRYGVAAAAPLSAKPTAYGRTESRQLRDYIHDRLDEEITLDQLASVARQTVHQLLICFRATFGMSPWQYIIAQRLRLAQRFLTHTRQDITTIAFAAGFSSHSHLTRAFRQHLGCTPKAFREGKQGALRI